MNDKRKIEIYSIRTNDNGNTLYRVFLKENIGEDMEILTVYKEIREGYFDSIFQYTIFTKNKINIIKNKT